MALRPYQTEAVEAVLGAWQEARATLLVACTGSGKTVMFSEIARRRRPHGRVLVIAHRSELIEQAHEQITTWTGLKCGIEMAHQRASLDGLFDPPDVVIASVQTLAQPKRLERIDPRQFGTVIVDEAHHTPSPTYRRILGHLEGAKVLGVTATPDRLDQSALGAIYESIAYTYETRDAIEQGYLCPVTVQQIVVEGLDLSEVRRVSGDFSPGELEEELVEHIHGVASPLSRLARGRQTIVFCVTINHAAAMAQALENYVDADRIAWLSGGASAEERADVLDQFRDRSINYLLNVGLFTEGVDLPMTDCIAMARPTQSRALSSNRWRVQPWMKHRWGRDDAAA